MWTKLMKVRITKALIFWKWIRNFRKIFTFFGDDGNAERIGTMMSRRRPEIFLQNYIQGTGFGTKCAVVNQLDNFITVHHLFSLY